MKYLPWLSVMLVASLPVVGCGSDSDADSGSAGNAGSVASAGRAGGSSAGAPSAGAPAVGAAGAAGAAAGQGGSGGAETEAKDIIDTAVAAGSFTKLAAALTSAGLVEALKGPGPFTVFAPTDAAFAAFETANPGVLAGLSKAALTEILTYHVVAGAAVASKDLKDE